MASPAQQRHFKTWLMDYASRLRFPWLLALTATLFIVDLAVPDFIPFADEMVLGLLTTLLATLKKRRGKRQSSKAGERD